MIRKITVIGAGVMGHGIAQVFALAGISVSLYDVKSEVLAHARGRIDLNLDLFVKNQMISLHEKMETLQRISITTSLEESLQDSEMVIEAIPERLDWKWELFERIESICRDEVIIASNTSTIPLSELIKHARHPERFIIAHFLNPAPLVPLVEVIKHECTLTGVVDQTVSILAKIGKTPVVLKKEVPGFIVNRLQAALLREAFSLISEGVADAMDIDRIVKDGPGFRWAFMGPMETADFGGLDTWKRVLENLYPYLDNSLKAPECLNELVHQDQLGVKTGKGFYSYEASSIDHKLMERDNRLMNLIKVKNK